MLQFDFTFVKGFFDVRFVFLQKRHISFSTDDADVEKRTKFEIEKSGPFAEKRQKDRKSPF